MSPKRCLLRPTLPQGTMLKQLKLHCHDIHILNSTDGKLRICRLGVVGAHGERIFLLGNISETNFCLFQPEADRSLGHLTRVTIATGPHTCILMGALSSSQDSSQIISFSCCCVHSFYSPAFILIFKRSTVCLQPHKPTLPSGS